MRKIKDKEELHEGYQGWSNWETWNVALWIQNDESAYRIVQKAYNADNLEDIVINQIYPDGTPDMDSAREFGPVNWVEVYEDAILDESNTNENEPIQENASQNDWFLRNFDYESIAVGLYWWCTDNHSGQSSDGYKALSILSELYRPGRSESGVEPGTQEEMVYDRIESEAMALSLAQEVVDYMMEESTNDDSEPIQEKANVKKIIGDLAGDFSGSNEEQMKGVQLLKGLATSDEDLANKFMKKLDAATTKISKELTKDESVEDEIITVDRDAQINEEDALEPGDRIRIVRDTK